VLVTHDQEEAMDVADRVAVMNEGRVEQTGKPRDLYEHPANEFVMSFVGPAHRLGEAWIRPHDLEVRQEPNGSSTEAMVERVVHLGFEVRAELVLEDGRRVSAQVTRNEADELELREGQIVFVRPSRTHVFSAVATPQGHS
jgi:sulfate transport system ATP-binding protein